VSQESLKTAIFPVGNLTKDVVKKIASATGFDKIAKKKESMGICFVGKRKQGFAGFLGEYVQPSPGPLVDIETYKNVGQHNGIHLCTIGQRCLLKSRKQKSFVVEKDLTTNTVYVCFGEDHPALYSENFFTDNPYWIDQAPDELRDRSKDQVRE
jgi:tRNA U34 2-thiouridine synthase MnmA/TrmU